MRKLTKILSAVLFLSFAVTTSQGEESITLVAPSNPPMAGHLKMGGKNPKGDELNVNAQYLTLNGRPIFPVMGEFHYARYPRQEWEREILKMKAGGINVISAYIFWIHHEEVEGQFEWTGDKDLRHFIELCAKHGLQCYIRLGPWDHGEVRNGGFPDWLMKKIPARQQRTTDAAFMDETRKFYVEMFNQVKGLLYKDGGPIIGVQVENEMRGNAPYLLALKNMAREIGFDVPYYSMTGWGPARVPEDELLPLFGGYADGFWIDGSAVSGASRIQFFFTHNPNDERTAMTSAPGEAPASLAYLSRYPYLTCEIGGGMAISYLRRPLMPWNDMTAVAMGKLGSGSNLMGYYMYHGGANPPGKLSTLQETQATNYPNDMPVVNYDFQAPLGQFGEVRQTYHALRLLHMFLQDFGDGLATMPSTLPAEMPKNLQDTQTIRWAVRSDGQHGCIFINNHQRGDVLPAKDVQFVLHTAQGDVKVPAAPTKFPADTFMMWPFNRQINGISLRYATAQPVCRIGDEGTPLVCFFAAPGVDTQFAFDTKTLASVEAGTAKRSDVDGVTILSGFTPGPDCVVTLRSTDGRQAKFLLLTQDQAMHLWKAEMWGAPRLFSSPGNLVFDQSNLIVTSNDPADMSVSVFPSPGASLRVNGKTMAGTPNGLFTRFAASATLKQIKLETKQIKEPGPARKISMGSKNKPEMPSDADFDAAAVWQVSIPKDALDNAGSVLLSVNYAGDVARAYIGDRLIDDDFYFGQPWHIGLNRFAPEILEKGLTLKILPLRKDFPVVIQPDKMPAFNDKGEALQLRGIDPVVEYEVTMQAAP